MTSAELDGSIILTYNEQALLIGYLIEGKPTEKQRTWIMKSLSKFNSIDDVMIIVKSLKEGAIVEKPLDLSFDYFWTKYNYKLGHKKRTKALWDKLIDSERTRALNALPKYDAFLKQKKGIDKAYPETYLSQCRWENFEE
jgi:hypothetical protein